MATPDIASLIKAASERHAQSQARSHRRLRRNGIRVDGIVYTSPELMLMHRRHGDQMVTVLCDTRDLSFVYVVDAERGCLVSASCL